MLTINKIGRLCYGLGLCLLLFFPNCVSLRKASPKVPEVKPITEKPSPSGSTAVEEKKPVEEKQREEVSQEEIREAELFEEISSVESPPSSPSEKLAPEKKIVKQVPVAVKKDEPQEEEQLLTLNFDNADIYDVIHTLGEVLGINYIIDPKVRGTVNIRTSDKIRKRDLLRILEAIFRVNNLTAVKEGNIYHIIPTSEAPRRFITPRIGKEKDKIEPSDEIIIQIVPLNFVQVKEIINLIKPFLSTGAIITGFEKDNLLIITDFASNIKKVLEIIEVTDVDVFKEVNFRLFPLKNSEAEEVAKELEQIFGAIEISTKSGRGGGVSFIPIPRINNILVISSLPRILIEVENWIHDLDQVMPEEEVKSYVYFVENGNAKDLAEILNQLFEEPKREERRIPTPTRRRQETQPPGRRGRRQPAKTQTKTPATHTSSATIGAIAGEVKIIPHEATNSLIIKSTPRDYRIVRQILKELDIIPRQVVIEAIIAEVSLDRSTTFGFESILRTKSTTLGSEFGSIGLENLTERAVQAGGFTYNVIRGNVVATLNALASENKVHILSTPKIIASDNKEATIDIGEEVPLVSTEFRDVTQAGAVQTTIERRDTGVILRITPHINSTGLVTLDLDIEVSEAKEATVSGQSDISIFERKANTSLVVKDGHTILIGGLMEDTRRSSREEVPFLSRLPLLGFLFRSTSRTLTQTELIVLVTPHVVQTIEEAESISREYIEKVTKLRERLQARREKNLFQ
jgi:general secretion pathway protein D